MFIENDWLIDVVRGRVPKITIMRGIGERDSIGTGAAGEDIWRGNVYCESNCTCQGV